MSEKTIHIRRNIHNDPNMGEWYVFRGHYDNIEYLHNDGVWRKSTKHNDQYTGYFYSKVYAQKVLTLTQSM